MVVYNFFELKKDFEKLINFLNFIILIMKKIKLWLINVLFIKVFWFGIFVCRGMEKLWIFLNMFIVIK